MYTDVPKFFTWNKQLKSWEPRKRGTPVPGFADIVMTNTLGRLYTVHPKQHECFFLCLLLVNVPGPISFQYLRKVNGTSYGTFFDACRELHLLEDDNHWDLTLADAVLSSSPQQIRQLFSIILTTCFPSEASALTTRCIFFLDAPGGTGKTFHISLILVCIRSQNHIALAIPSSGIAATLLDGGRTAHSALKLPLNIHTNPEALCNIKKHSGMPEALRKCKIIIWDECTMAHKHSLEALDRALKDIKDNTRLFGGALLLLSDDFRQTLPVIPRATYADEINACLKESYLWRSVSILCLTLYMRVQLQNDPLASRFSEQLLDIGNGKIRLYEDTQYIRLPQNFCNMVPTKEELIKSIFPDLPHNYTNHAWLRERAILAAKNLDLDAINFKVQQSLPGSKITFNSIDTVVDPDEVVNYPAKFLNSLDLPGMPTHNLRLKIGSPIILLINLNAPKLCNGTR
ncbi:uncharacterized protein [Parasteatoda tepidariorum]|uniref:uncharacterized protein n=1 Tax=Parasteatoda tepidariorum TaxID=114398 RepID=UPI0039BC8F92